LSLGRRPIANTIARWTGIGCGTLASVVLTPYLIQHLGDERFGIYQISRHLTLYVALLDFGLIASVMRFASRAIASKDDQRLNEITSSALVLFSGIALAGFLACIVVARGAPGFFGVDEAYAMEMRWLFLGLGGWWAITMLAIPARGVFIGHQRWGLLSFVTAGGWVLTVVAVIGLFETGHVGLQAVGLAFLIGGIFQLLASHTIARLIQPTLRWSRRFVDRAILRTLYSFGLWNMLFAISGLFLWSSDSIVIGRMLGPEVVPFYAIPFMLIHYGRIVVLGFAAQMTPVAAAHAAENNTAGLRATLIRSTRIGLILTLAGNGILLLMVEDLLRLWVGARYAPSWIIYAGLMLSFWAVYANFSIHQILIGAGDIRAPAAITLIATLTTLMLKAVALGWFGAGIETLPLLNCVLVLPVVLIYIPWCACRLAGISLIRLYREAYLGPILAFIPVAGAGWFVTRYLSPLNLIEFCALFVLFASSYLLISLWTLSASERASIVRMIKAPRASLQRPRTAAPD